VGGNVEPIHSYLHHAETNIMVGTHADSLIAEAVIKGITNFDLDLAYEAVYKDATVPPINDQTTS
jgi:putative alpha-1,2-mannosidase